MTAYIAMLTNPAPGKYLLRFKRDRESDEQELDLSIDQLRNIIMDGASYAFQHDRMSKPDCLRLNRAIDMLHRPGTRMMIMHANDGDHFYVVPGGRVNRDDAQKILKRPDIIEFDDGLFPGNPQSWQLMR